MIKFILKTIIFVCLLAIAGVIYISYSYKSRAEKYIEEIITAEARRSNINLAFEDLKLNLIGAHAKSLSIFLPRAFLSFTIDKPRIDFSLLSAIRMAPAVNFSGNFYDSSILGTTIYNITSHNTSGRFSLQNLDLNKVTQVSFLGLQSGTLNFNLAEFNANNSGPQLIQGNYALQNLSTLKPNILPIRISNEQQTLTIPPIQDFNIMGSFLFEDFKFSLKDGKVNSDLGNSDYSADLVFSRTRGVENIFVNATIKLSSKGSEYFGFLLPIISNNILNSGQSEFIFNIEGKPNKVDYTYRPLN